MNLKSKVLKLLVLLMFSACKPPEPKIFGVNYSVWVTLPESEKEQIIQKFNRKSVLDDHNRQSKEVVKSPKRIIASIDVI